MSPKLAPGKIAYVQIPTTDVDRSAAFYEVVFGWNIRRHGDGDLAFDDTVGEVSGTWVTNRVERALEKIVDAAGEVVTPLTGQGEGEAFATFRDPAGNVLGVFEQRS